MRGQSNPLGPSVACGSPQECPVKGSSPRARLAQRLNQLRKRRLLHVASTFDRASS